MKTKSAKDLLHSGHVEAAQGEFKQLDSVVFHLQDAPSTLKTVKSERSNMFKITGPVFLSVQKFPPT